MEGGPPSFAPGFSFRALLRNTATDRSRRPLPGSHRLWPPVPGKFTWPADRRPQVLQPRAHKEHGLGLDPFRSPLLRTSRLISLPPGTEMFQFPGFASLQREMTDVAASRVAPFGHLGITACVPLPRASRSLPRPSSPPCAQASPTCLPSLDHIWLKHRTRLRSQSTIPILIYRRADDERQPGSTRDSVKIPFPTNQSSAQRPEPTTHPLSFTCQIATATRLLSR